MPIQLIDREKRVRKLLIRIAKGDTDIHTHRPGMISYKELWTRFFRREWGRARTNEIVGMITRISAYDLSHQRPPLNELVVDKLVMNQVNFGQA